MDPVPRMQSPSVKRELVGEFTRLDFILFHSVEGIGNLGLLQQKKVKHVIKRKGNDEALELEYKPLMTVSDVLHKLPLSP